MPRFFYHGTTQLGHEAIQKSGAIEPQSGNTYQNKIFLAGNDQYARRITFLKHGQYQGETIVIYKIPKYVLKRKFLDRADQHISNMASYGDKTWSYSEPIPITAEILVGQVPYFLNLPEGVTLFRDGKKTGYTFTQEAAKQFGLEDLVDWEEA